MATINYKDKYEKAVQAAMLAKQDTESAVTIGILEEIFPELRESEDERIRKEIISAIKEDWSGHTDWIAWLEKQEEQELNDDEDILQRFSFYSYKDEPNILYLSRLYVNEECRNKGIGTKILEVADEVAKSLNCNAIRLKTKKDSNAEKLYRTHGYNSLATEESDEIWLEKQGEQNPAEDKGMNLVEEEMTPFQKKVFCIIDTSIEEEQGLKQVCEELLALAANEIEQKFTWSEEDTRLLDNCINLIEDIDCTKEEQKFLKNLKNHIQSQPKREWKQENTGDLTDFENAMMHIGNSFFGQHPGLNPNNTNAIKEQANLLLELVPRQEWSKEDKKMVNDTIDCLKKPFPYALEYEQPFKRNIDWLKSLKERYTWKPSDEQLKALWNVYQGGEEQAELATLYNDLKKLRKE